MPEICIIGSGNVAWHMYRLCTGAGHRVVQIVSRNIESAKTIISGDNVLLTENIAKTRSDANIYIICVNDDSIQEVATAIKNIIPTESIVLHTSGTQSVHILSHLLACTGIIWPIQTLTKGVSIEAGNIPIVVNAIEQKNIVKIVSFIKTLGTPVHVIEDQDKIKLHLAAVMINNFTNHLITLTQQYLEEKKLPFELVKPLLIQTIEKLNTSTAYVAQTGPARRGDLNTIQKHLSLLDDQPELRTIYKLFSESIITTYSNTKLDENN